jgi:hypothetical protein
MSQMMDEVEQLRAKGWYFQFWGNEDGWQCLTVGAGLAHGEGGGETIEKAAETALGMARTMEDDPEVILKQYGPQIEKLALEAFGKGVFQGMEAVKWEPGEPVRIAISMAPKVGPKAYVEQEHAFNRRAIDELPRDVSRALVFEVDWPEERS